MPKKHIDYIRDKVNEFLVSELKKLEPGSLVLDAGAGDPDFQIRDERLRFVGLDLCVGQEDWDYSGIDVVGDLFAVPFQDNSFDAVICSQTLEHVTEPESVLAQLQRVLRPGGVILISVPQEWYLHQPPHDYFRFTKFGLEYLLVKTGFSVREIQPTGGYFLMLSHRISLFPRFFFPPPKNIVTKILRKPFKEAIELFFMSALPRLFKFMDKYDVSKYSTAGHSAVAVKKAH